MHAALILLIDTAVDTAPDENDVVAGWTAFALFGLLILAVAVLGFSLTKRLKNVEKAADAGLYDPSTERRQRPARGLAAARQMQAQAAADAAASSTAEGSGSGGSGEADASREPGEPTHPQ